MQKKRKIASLKSILDIFNLADCCKEKVYLSINAQESL